MSGFTHHRPTAEDVFDVLVKEHADMLEVYLRSLLGRGADVDDLFQETIVVAWRRFDEFDRDRSFAAWLRGIARVLVLRHHRLDAGRARLLEPAVLEELEARFDLLATRSGDTFRERAEHLLDCLSKLPDAMREVIELVHLRGLSIVAAARSMDLSEETLKKRAQRGRTRLAECLRTGGV